MPDPPEIKKHREKDKRKLPPLKSKENHGNPEGVKGEKQKSKSEGSAPQVSRQGGAPLHLPVSRFSMFVWDWIECLRLADFRTRSARNSVSRAD